MPKYQTTTETPWTQSANTLIDTLNSVFDAQQKRQQQEIKNAYDQVKFAMDHGSGADYDRAVERYNKLNDRVTGGIKLQPRNPQMLQDYEKSLQPQNIPAQGEFGPFPNAVQSPEGMVKPETYQPAQTIPGQQPNIGKYMQALIQGEKMSPENAYRQANLILEQQKLSAPKERPFDANNQMDVFLASYGPKWGVDITTQEGYKNAIRKWGTPEGQAAWKEFQKTSENFKRPGTYQVGQMNGKSYAIQGNPNNNQLEYFDPIKKMWATVPPQMEFSNQVLSPADAAILGLAYGTTKAEAAGQGVMGVPTQKRGESAAFDQSMNVLSDIETASKKVNTFTPGFMGTNRLIQGGQKAAGAAMQTDEEAKRLETKAGELSNIIRAMGEKGTLAEGDVKRGLLLIPTVWDTKAVAENKIGDLRKLFMQNKASNVESLTRQFPAKRNKPIATNPEEIQVGNFTVRIKR